jgi:hypothetical protein
MTRPSPRKAALAGALLGVLAACTRSTLLCGCEPVPPSLHARGTVRTAAGAPVAGAKVSARVMLPSCAVTTTVVMPEYGEKPTTSGTGAYDLTFYGVHGSNVCVRVVAERTALDTISSDTVFFHAGSADSSRVVNLVFP